MSALALTKSQVVQTIDRIANALDAIGLFIPGQYDEMLAKFLHWAVSDDGFLGYATSHQAPDPESLAAPPEALVEALGRFRTANPELKAPAGGWLPFLMKILALLSEISAKAPAA